MAGHPVVPFDQALIDDIAAAMDLRAPNREALEALAKRFDDAGGEPFEAVCAMATAVGKTYLAGALIEYLARSGIRNFMIVVPRTPVLDKTVNNFTRGHPKSVIGGMECDPVLFTVDNFNTGAMGAALSDDSRVKVGVFTVQSLLRPKGNKVTRRVTKHQEWLGEGLYQYLQGRDDLVVIADESHTYREKATAFSAAVRELDAMATVGLTATPDKAEEDRIVYRYPLGRAIADRWVKTPVVVGRKDDASDIETRLRDGLVLLDAKQRLADDYAAATGKPRVNAVMFVIADTTDNADAVAEVLAKPDLFGADYERRTLVVHSKAADDALTRLAAVEDPDSPVRVIVSVDMLKEGWDVKNIFVICSLRPLISELLQEQTLGRGLRLPWGAYTGTELLDTLEVLAHERYVQLLRKADVLVKGLTDDRVTEAAVTPVAAPAAHAHPPAAEPAAGDTVLVTPTAGGDSQPTGGGGGPSGTSGGAPELFLTSQDDRQAQAAAEAEASSTVTPTGEVRIPDVERTVTARVFSLSDVDEAVFADLGRRFAAVAGETLTRQVLDVVADPAAPGGYRVVAHEATDAIAAAPMALPFDGAAQAFREAILSFDIVPTDANNARAAKRLVAAAVEAAGGEDALAAQLNAVINAARLAIHNAYKESPAVEDITVVDRVFAPTRLNTRPVEPSRVGKFTPTVAYSGWAKSLHPLNWFDTNPERAIALLADDKNSGVALWYRIQRGEVVVRWEGGRYSPDLYATDGNDRHWLIEIKADRDLDRPEVQAKKAAAERWARHVTDNGDHGTWTYLLMPQSAAESAKTFQAAVTQAGGGR